MVWVYSVYRSLVSFSNTVSAAQAHAAKCSGFSERVAQNSARHCLLHCWCEHLHCKFTAFLALLSFNFKSSSSFYKLLLHSQHTLLAFTVSGIFKEGELFSSRLSSCSIQLDWLCYCRLFFSCCWCKVPWVHHGVLSSIHYSPSWKYWVGLAMIAATWQKLSHKMWNWHKTEVHKDVVNVEVWLFSRLSLCNSLCIVNDQLFIRMATTEEIRRAFVAPAPTPSSSPVPTLTASQQDMLTAFSQKSGMNLEWSQKWVIWYLQHCSRPDNLIT